MKDKLLYPFLAGLLIMAVSASAKAIIDVHVLNSKMITFKELLFEVRRDVKEIKDHIIKEKHK